MAIELATMLHYDGTTSADLGYRCVGTLDNAGGHAAACSVRE
jgi:hypothetical protein